MTIPQTFHGFGLSPEETSPEPTHSLDDDALDDLNDFKPSFNNPSAAGRKGANPRKGPGAADKRATHNAIERARRENLNGRFMTLAEALPTMHKVKRPSKSVIVNKALEFVYEAQVKEQTLVKENNELRREVNSLRQQLGLPPLAPPVAPAPAFKSPSGYGGRRTSDSLVSSMSSLDTNGASPQQQQQQQAVQLSPSSSSFPSPPSTVAATSEPSPVMPLVPTAGMFPNVTTTYETSPVDAADELRQQQLAALFPGQSLATLSAQVQAQAQAQAQAQVMMQAQLGYMNPAFLSAHHHSMLLAAHQAASAMQHQQQQQQHPTFPTHQAPQPSPPQQHQLQTQQPSPHQPQQQSPSPAASSGHGTAPSPTGLSPRDMYPNALGSSPMGTGAAGMAGHPSLGSWGSFSSTTTDGFTVFA
ncbi:hypothetical protein OIO90_006075 [Microbotryomycetes sp. JL221]|nr:hypothetical protein OIO90_006075 [Microbotryomycetes sp. JL221]